MDLEVVSKYTIPNAAARRRTFRGERMKRGSTAPTLQVGVGRVTRSLRRSSWKRKSMKSQKLKIFLEGWIIS